MPYQPNYKYIPPLNKDWLTPIYDFSCSIVGLGKSFKRKVLHSINIKDSDTLIDVGCGTGVLIEIVKKEHPNLKIIGFDPDVNALRIAKRRLSKAGLQAEIIETFAENLPLPDSSIDIAFSTLVFHHLPKEIKQKAIAEIYRVLKPQGKIVIADFGPAASGFLARLLHLFENIEYLEDNLKGLIPIYLEQAGFAEIKTISKHFPGTAIVSAIKPFA